MFCYKFFCQISIHSLLLLGQKEQDLLQVPESLISTTDGNGILYLFETVNFFLTNSIFYICFLRAYLIFVFISINLNISPTINKILIFFSNRIIWHNIYGF